MTDRFPISTKDALDVAPAITFQGIDNIVEDGGVTVESDQAVHEPNLMLSDNLLDARVRLHRRLLEECNLAALENLSDDEIRKHIAKFVRQYVQDENLSLNSQEFDDFVTEVLNEMNGLGSIEPLIKDPTVGDIMINGCNCVYVERGGMLEQTSIRFRNDAHLLR